MIGRKIVPRGYTAFTHWVKKDVHTGAGEVDFLKFRNGIPKIKLCCMKYSEKLLAQTLTPLKTNNLFSQFFCNSKLSFTPIKDPFNSDSSIFYISTMIIESVGTDLKI